jgi:hypothetical protein
MRLSSFRFSDQDQVEGRTRRACVLPCGPSWLAVADPFILHPTGRYDGSSREAIAAFKAVLDRARLPSTVRLTRGRDIAAACGQLAAIR